MIVYVINIALILLWGFLLISINPTKQKKALFCVIASFQWALISGLRHFSVGNDTMGYVRNFIRTGTRSWKTVLTAFVDVYFRGREAESSAENNLYKDPGYLVFQKLMHIFTDDPQVYLLLVAAILFAALAYFIYKNSEDPVFSYILFSSLFYSFFAITGIRQSLATALVVFIGYEFIKQNKLWKFAIVALIGFTLHKSVLVFILFYWISKIKVTWKYILALICAVAAGLAIGAPFILKAAELFGYEQEELFQADTTTYTAAIAVIGVVMIVFSKSIQRQGKYKNIEINATLIAVALTFFTSISQGVMRVQQYYSLFLMLSIPSLLQCFQKRVRVILRVAAVLLFVVYLLMNNPQYRFFWQTA